MQPDNSRNTIIFAVCAVIILLVYQFLVVVPEANRRKAEAARHPAATAQAAAGSSAPGVGPAIGTYRTRAEARAASPRIPVETPMLHGSISLRGGRIDDLYLKQYHTTLDPKSPLVELLRPEGLPNAYFATFGWAGQNIPNLPRAGTLWELKSGRVLTPATPVVLTYDNGAGLRFTRTISVDDQYMFTVSDTVANLSGQPVSLLPYSTVQRRGFPHDANRNMVVHEGAIGVVNGALQMIKYKDWVKQTPEKAFDEATRGGWLGITDKYWMAALAPNATESGHGKFRVSDLNGVKVLEAVFEGRLVQIGPNRQITRDTRLFAGAKRNEILKGYETELGITQFDLAIDWGKMFWIFTRPLFAVLEFFYKHIGNFGLSILLLTVCAKLLFFPLANQAFASMAKIKKLQPKQEEIKKKYADDPTRQQQEMMALYQKEKINPLAGCLPILIQIPVFFSLYKVLFVTIEMRHAPFFGWIHDLSARDPSTMWNLFGLIPWDPATAPLIGGFLDSTLHIGVWPLLYGITMWLQTSMSPASPDPTQQTIMRWFPVIFTVLLAQSPAGLVIYWAWSNLLTIIQQYIIMRRHDTANPIDGLIARIQGKEYKVPG
ncbi:MAG: membrane protein insertase YidC [Caulobacteraceae bacterium]|nr:membrane protein insertase YidC [Caulobacteraceae bacterium]